MCSQFSKKEEKNHSPGVGVHTTLYELESDVGSVRGVASKVVHNFDKVAKTPLTNKKRDHSDPGLFMMTEERLIKSGIETKETKIPWGRAMNLVLRFGF